MYVRSISRRFFQSPHQILGISQNASPKEIKAAYFKLAKQYHPDVYKGDPEQFKRINEAYSQLTNPSGYAKADPYSYHNPSEDISPEKDQEYRQAFYWKMQEEHKRYEQQYNYSEPPHTIDPDSIRRNQNLLLLATGLLILIPILYSGRSKYEADQKNLRETLQFIEENEKDMIAFRRFEEEMRTRRRSD